MTREDKAVWTIILAFAVFVRGCVRNLFVDYLAELNERFENIDL